MRPLFPQGRRFFWRLLNPGFALLVALSAGLQGEEVAGQKANGRPWATLGDSITEGFTYPLWVSQSLVDAGRAAPVWINAGVGGDTAAKMLSRLEQDVIAQKPGLVFFSAGINDVVSGETEKFQENAGRIFQRMKESGIPVCVLTTTALGGKHLELNATLAEMNAFLRRKAGEMDFRVAEVFAPFLEAVKKGQPVLEGDGVHLTMEGYRVMAAAVLRALEPAVVLSASFEPAAEPGILKQWQIRKIGESTLAGEVSLPESEPLPSWWHNQERRRGYILNLKRFVPDAERFQAAGEFELAAPSCVRIRVGGKVESLTVDGEPFAITESHLKWGVREAGLTRKLGAGKHRIEVIAGDAFFLSCVPTG